MGQRKKSVLILITVRKVFFFFLNDCEPENRFFNGNGNLNTSSRITHDNNKNKHHHQFVRELLGPLFRMVCILHNSVPGAILVLSPGLPSLD